MTNYIVTQNKLYNTYSSKYNHPAFKSALLTPINNDGVHLQTQQLDTADIGTEKQIQEKTKKQGLSKGAKWSIGAAIVAGLGLLTYILTQGRTGSKQIQQLAKHIDFQPAKTIEDARAFANKTLNVQYLHEDIANLDMINTVNEWLYREKTVIKNNIPDFINFVEKFIENPLGITDKIYYEGKAFNALNVNVNFINKFDNLIEYVLKPNNKNAIDLSKLIYRDNKGVYKITNPEYKCENLDKLIQKLNNYNKNSTYKDKMEIYDGFSEAVAYLGNINAGRDVKMANFSADGAFLHEMGHMLHQDTYKFWNDATKQNSKIYQEFQQPDIQKIAEQVSNYAKTNPLEFVAETYKRIRRGQTFSEDVMQLYRKYKGPSIS